MILSSQTVSILKSISGINSNLVIKTGSNISTISASKDIIASYTCEEEFDKQIAIFNLNEFLGVLGAFDKPELELSDKSVTVFQGKQKVQYNYADVDLLIKPPEKGVKFPSTDVTIELKDSVLSKLQKMSNILGSEDMAIIGDGSSIMIKIFDKKNPSTNIFEIELDDETIETFQFDFKMEKLKLYAGTYKIELSSKKISKFTHSTIDLMYYIAVESSSFFN